MHSSMRAQALLISTVLLATSLPSGAVRSAEGPLTTLSLHERPRGEEEPVFMMPGQYRIRYIHLPEIALDELGTSHGQEDYATNRLRLSPRFNFGKGWKLQVEADFLDGLLVGDTTSVGNTFLDMNERGFRQDYLNRRTATSLEGAQLRKAFLEWRSEIGLFRLGQMGSQWGLGILANSGDDWGAEFDDQRGGDLVERFLYATQPFMLLGDSDFARAFVVGLAGDLVYEDENASLIDGDIAWQGVISVSYRPPGYDLGVYIAYRNQTDDDGDTLEAVAYDISGGLKQKLGDFELRAQAEAVILTGTTNRARLEGAPEMLDIRSFGWAALLGFGYEDIGFDASFEAGYASGDNNRSDGTVRSFSFDANHKIGMILFEDVLGRMSVRALDRVADPGLSGVPPKGFETIPTNGAVTNAWYINPILRYRPMRQLVVKGGLVWGVTDGDLVDPYNTAANGGYNASYRGATGGGGDLGVELDGAVEFEMPVADLMGFRVGVQGGVLFPGEAFDDAQGNVLPEVGKVRVLADIVW